MNTETIFGINAVESRLRLPGSRPLKLILVKGKTSARLMHILTLAEDLSCPVEHLAEHQFERMTDLKHQGVALEVKRQIGASEEVLYDIASRHKGNLLLLVLDGITDPRNLGACIRSAATLGAHAVVVPKNKIAPMNEAAVKTASGAALYVPFVQVTNLARTLGKLQKMGVWVVGTLLDAKQTIADIDMRGDIALVLGSEDKGLRYNTIKHCDYLARIPMQNEKFGFNVSVATGICLYEAGRQRQDGQ